MKRAKIEVVAQCHFLPSSQRDHAPPGAVVSDVSRSADLPYRTLSLFFVHGGLPVPAMPGKTSNTAVLGGRSLRHDWRLYPRRALGGVRGSN